MTGLVAAQRAWTGCGQGSHREGFYDASREARNERKEDYKVFVFFANYNSSILKLCGLGGRGEKSLIASRKERKGRKGIFMVFMCRGELSEKIFYLSPRV